MVRRLFVGLIVGLLVGCVVAAGVVGGLRIHELSGTGGAVLGYLGAALTGVLTGLVAGKPIWAADAKIEAGLKAFFGAAISAGLMFALRQWGGAFQPDLSFIGAGHGAVGDLPAASFPLLAAVLGAFFELDNTGDGAAQSQDESGRERKRVGRLTTNGSSKARVLDTADSGDGEEAEVASRRAKR
jgi:hypothetical protein